MKVNELTAMPPSPNSRSPVEKYLYLHADVHVRAERILEAEDRLPCKGAVLVVNHLDLCPADAEAGLEGQSVLVAEVGQAVDHEGERADRLVDVEVRVDDRSVLPVWCQAH